LHLRRCGLALALCGLAAMGPLPAQAQNVVQAHVGWEPEVAVHDVQPGALAQAAYTYREAGTQVQLQSQATRRSLFTFISGQDSRMDTRIWATSGARSRITLVDEAGQAVSSGVAVDLRLRARATTVFLEALKAPGPLSSVSLSFAAVVDGATGPAGVVARWSRHVGQDGIGYSNCLGTPDLCVEGSWPQLTDLDFTLEPALVDNGFTLEIGSALSTHSGADGPESGVETYLSIPSASATWSEVSGAARRQQAVRMPERIGLRFDETGEILWANAAPVPEPGVWALLSAGLLVLAVLRWRRGSVLLPVGGGSPAACRSMPSPSKASPPSPQFTQPGHRQGAAGCASSAPLPAFWPA
jgi:hypothetical protein